MSEGLKEQQPPLDIEGQIENLKSIGLIIENEDNAKEFLNDVSYFRLIKAYSLGLKPKNGNYADGITFERIVELYLFNSNLRQLIFPLIEEIEINLRCRVANYFSSKYGCLGYEDSNNFDDPTYHNKFIDDMALEVERNSRAPFVSNFHENYIDGKIPFYALVELMSFGTLSKFYKNMVSEDKKAISRSFGIGYTYFESWIESIAFVRNICAHYGRLYNTKLAKTPILYKQYREQGVGNNRVFGVLLCMKHILNHDWKHWNIFCETIESLFEKYPDIDKSLMGFTENWHDILA